MANCPLLCHGYDVDIDRHFNSLFYLKFSALQYLLHLMMGNIPETNKQKSLTNVHKTEIIYTKYGF